MTGHDINVSCYIYSRLALVSPGQPSQPSECNNHKRLISGQIRREELELTYYVINNVMFPLTYRCL